MSWFMPFVSALFDIFNDLVDFMTTPLDILGWQVTPVVLLTSSLIAFMVAMLALRILRG